MSDLPRLHSSCTIGCNTGCNIVPLAVTHLQITSAGAICNLQMTANAIRSRARSTLQIKNQSGKILLERRYHLNITVLQKGNLFPLEYDTCPGYTECFDIMKGLMQLKQKEIENNFWDAVCMTCQSFIYIYIIYWMYIFGIYVQMITKDNYRYYDNLKKM